MSKTFEQIDLKCAVVGRSVMPDGRQRLTVQLLAPMKNTVVELAGPSSPASSAGPLTELLSRPLTGIFWPPRVREAFTFERMVFLGDLCSMTEKRLRRNPGIGNKTIRNIVDTLKAYNLDLGMQLPWWEAYRETLPPPDAGTVTLDS